MFYVEFSCRMTFSVKTNLSSFFKFTTWDSSCRIYNAKNRSRVLRCNIKHICNCSKLMKTFTEHRQSSQAHSQWKILNVAYKWKETWNYLVMLQMRSLFRKRCPNVLVPNLEDWPNKQNCGYQHRKCKGSSAIVPKWMMICQLNLKINCNRAWYSLCSFLSKFRNLNSLQLLDEYFIHIQIVYFGFMELDLA